MRHPGRRPWDTPPPSPPATVAPSGPGRSGHAGVWVGFVTTVLPAQSLSRGGREHPAPLVSTFTHPGEARCQPPNPRHCPARSLSSAGRDLQSLSQACLERNRPLASVVSVGSVTTHMGATAGEHGGAGPSVLSSAISMCPPSPRMGPQPTTDVKGARGRSSHPGGRSPRSPRGSQCVLKSTSTSTSTQRRHGPVKRAPEPGRAAPPLRGSLPRVFAGAGQASETPETTEEDGEAPQGKRAPVTCALRSRPRRVSSFGGENDSTASKNRYCEITRTGPGAKNPT